MNETRHELDEAIDCVAAKMVAVDDDAGALQAAITRLPDRESRPWFLRMPVQLAAAAALVMIAFVFGRPSNERSSVEANLPARVGFALASYAAPPGRRSAPVFRLPTADSRLPAVSVDRPDHERSLAPVDAFAAIEISALTMPAFAPVAMEALAPLVLTDLPLASDSSSPHER